MKTQMSIATDSVKVTGFLRRGLRAAAESAVITPIICIFTLGPFVVSGPRAGTFALAAYIGLVTSTAGYAGRTNPKRIKNIDEPEYVNQVRTIVVLLYFNAMIVLGTTLGLAGELAGYGEFAYVIAVLVPAVDSALARLSLPSLGLAGGILIRATEIIGKVVSRLVSDSEFWDGISNSREYIPDIDTLYGEYQFRLDEMVRIWS
jgi:hypothetical protein